MAAGSQPAKAGISLNNGISNDIVLLFSFQLNDHQWPLDRRFHIIVRQYLHQLIEIVIHFDDDILCFLSE